MSRNVLEEIVPSNWDAADSTGGAPRTRWLQQLTDLVNRPVNNRQTVSTSTASTPTTGAVQSTGVGVGPMTPKRYAEFTVKARVTFNAATGSHAYVYLHRTTGAIPANGQAPNAGDVIVGGDAFTGGAVTPGTNQVGALSFLDSGLSVNKKYNYYLSVQGANGDTVKLLNASQLLVMERS
jgi:hypothetical protein